VVIVLPDQERALYDLEWKEEFLNDGDT